MTVVYQSRLRVQRKLHALHAGETGKVSVQGQENGGAEGAAAVSYISADSELGHKSGECDVALAPGLDTHAVEPVGMEPPPVLSGSEVGIANLSAVLFIEPESLAENVVAHSEFRVGLNHPVVASGREVQRNRNARCTSYISADHHRVGLDIDGVAVHHIGITYLRTVPVSHIEGEIKHRILS